MAGAAQTAPLCFRSRFPVGRLFVCPLIPLLRQSGEGWTSRLRRSGTQEKTMSHKYHLHQLVRLARPGFSHSRASSSGVYEVTRLMPADQTGEVSYRIKSSGGERAVRESEIAAPVTDA
jgi:hypothetical protein